MATPSSIEPDFDPHLTSNYAIDQLGWKKISYATATLNGVQCDRHVWINFAVRRVHYLSDDDIDLILSKGEYVDVPRDRQLALEMQDTFHFITSSLHYEKVVW